MKITPIIALTLTMLPILTLISGCNDITSDAEKHRITLSQYDDLQEGQGVSRAISKLGQTFDVTQSTSGGQTMKLLHWDNANGSFAEVTVIGGKIFSKRESGLTD